MEVVSNSNIPPISSLPQWPRVGLVERTVGPPKQREHHKEREFVQTQSQCETCGGPTGPDGVGIATTSFAGVDVQELTKHLDKSIQFLKGQQTELLLGLHDEVDRLKKENGKLQYQLVMNADKQTTAEPAPVEESKKGPAIDHEKVVSRLRKEIEELKVQLEEAKQKNGLLEKILDQQSSVNGASMEDIGDDTQQQMQLTMHTRAVDHCDRIIKHLQLVNEQQASEVTRLKAELKELLSTYRPAPDVGLLSNRNKLLADSVRLPKLASDMHSHRPFTPEVIPNATGMSATNTTVPISNTGPAMMVTNSLVPRPPSQPPPHAHSDASASVVPVVDMGRGSIHLPPLKQVVPSRVADRKKQIEVLHKARLRQLSSKSAAKSNSGNTKQ